MQGCLLRIIRSWLSAAGEMGGEFFSAADEFARHENLGHGSRAGRGLYTPHGQSFAEMNGVETHVVAPQ